MLRPATNLMPVVHAACPSLACQTLRYLLSNPTWPMRLAACVSYCTSLARSASCTWIIRGSMRARFLNVTFAVALVAFAFPQGAVHAQQQPARQGNPSSSPSTELNSSALPSTLSFAIPVVFVLASDPSEPVNSILTNTLTGELQRVRNGQIDQGASLIRNSWVVPEPTWSLSEYVQQCKDSPQTRGAFIILPTAVKNGSRSTLLYRRSTTELGLDVILADCEPFI